MDAEGRIVGLGKKTEKDKLEIRVLRVFNNRFPYQAKKKIPIVLIADSVRYTTAQILASSRLPYPCWISNPYLKRTAERLGQFLIAQGFQMGDNVSLEIDLNTNPYEVYLIKHSAAIIRNTSQSMFDQFKREPPNLRDQQTSLKDKNLNVFLDKDFAAQDSINKELGKAGEEWVLQIEKDRLTRDRRPDLAAKVEWISKTKGDGFGYDILSFDPATDKELFIEVKTTNSSTNASFFLTANELSFCKENSEHFRLYRVFNFHEKEKRGFFILSSEGLQNLRIVPMSYMVYV